MRNTSERTAAQAARHAEVSRRYAWQTRQRRKNLDQATLMTLLRLRDLERIFLSRYGRLLPDDDAGRDDLELAAHHIAHLHGEVVEHIVAWARAWAPWLPDDEAKAIAKCIAAEPRKWTADALAWRLRLSMAERMELKITTIGAYDASKAEREELRKIRRREAQRERRRRKAIAAGRAAGTNGRPKKPVASR